MPTPGFTGTVTLQMGESTVLRTPDRAEASPRNCQYSSASGRFHHSACSHGSTMDPTRRHSPSSPATGVKSELHFRRSTIVQKYSRSSGSRVKLYLRRPEGTPPGLPVMTLTSQSVTCAGGAGGVISRDFGSRSSVGFARKVALETVTRNQYFFAASSGRFTQWKYPRPIAGRTRLTTQR